MFNTGNSVNCPQRDSFRAKSRYINLVSKQFQTLDNTAYFSCIFIRIEPDCAQYCFNSCGKGTFGNLSFVNGIFNDVLLQVEVVGRGTQSPIASVSLKI